MADDLLLRVQALQQAHLDKSKLIEDRREQLRRDMPEIAALVDAFRLVFSEGVRVSYAEENGFCFGRKQ